MRLEDNLRQIFWQNSSLRNEALTVIEQCLEQLPFGFPCSSTLSVLEKSYTEAPNLHIDTARKLIDIIAMISIRSGRPDFFSVVEVVTVLLGIFSQRGIAQFGSAVESMFLRFSHSLQLLPVMSESCLRNYSRETLNMFLPNENEILLSAGKALCLKAMMSTFVWQYGSQTEIEHVWDCVRLTIEARRIETIHASLAERIIAVGFVGVVHPLNNAEIGAMLKAIACPLNNAVNASDVEFCKALCALITSILSHQSVIKYIRTLFRTDFDYIVRTYITLRSTLNRCNFNASRVFLDAVVQAKVSLDAIFRLTS
jgi:hypothetical protein